MGRRRVRGPTRRLVNHGEQWLARPPWEDGVSCLLLARPVMTGVRMMCPSRSPPSRVGVWNTVERINLERELVTSLTTTCRSVVVGYTVKREYVSTEYSAGIENIGFDSIEGLNSPIFIRTVKLKDFPWNGWLSLGIDTRPTAAWNPIAGFTDSFGRLMWSAVGDPALVPSPNDAGWMLNRISDVQSNPGR